VKRSVYSNKAFAHTQLNAAVKILGLTKNSFGQTLEQAETKTESLEVTTSSSSALEIKGQDTLEGQISIADADVVVSGGRGLKGPENWNMIEDLAEVLGAATACSKPVSDMGWRPHSEHVGQTGKPVASNLYIAIGISGAIQHLAGVSSSKVKVVINTDAEAPFVKAADYAVIGDAFEVVPQLIEKLKAFKIQNG
jgi:electron transfer flavoprotein alpha subunit